DGDRPHPPAAGQAGARPRDAALDRDGVGRRLPLRPVRNHPARDLAFATLVAALVSAAAWIGYGRHAGVVTFEILAPLGWLTVLVADRLIAHRERLRGPRRPFAAIAFSPATGGGAAVG